MTLEKLLQVNNKITGLLGRTINIREFAVKAFRKRIGEYVDSHNKKDEVQAWPLVKVCKLRHNWQVQHKSDLSCRHSDACFWSQEDAVHAAVTCTVLLRITVSLHCVCIESQPQLHESTHAACYWHICKLA